MFSKFCPVSQLHKKFPNFPFKVQTLYKWHHLRKHPGLLRKFSGRLFIDLEKFNELLEGKTSGNWLKKMR